MGRDKARVEIGGVATATRIARRLDELFDEVLLVGGDPPPDAPGRRCPDGDGPACALRGLTSALGAATRERVLVVATDLPLVSADLLLALVAWPEADAVLPRDAEGLQPLCALYRRDAVQPVARARLAAGDLALRGLIDAIDASTLGAEDLARVDPDGTALANVNTPEDVVRAEALLADARGRAPR